MKNFNFSILNLILNIIILLGGFYLTFSKPGQIFMSLPKYFENNKKQIEEIKQKIDKTYGKITKINNVYDLNGFKKTCIRKSDDKKLNDYSVYYDEASNVLPKDELNDLGSKRIILYNSYENRGSPAIIVLIASITKGKNKTKYAFAVSERVFNILTNNSKGKVACDGIKFKIKKYTE